MKNKKKEIILVDVNLTPFNTVKERDKYCYELIKSFKKELKKRGPSVIVYDSKNVRSVGILHV